MITRCAEGEGPSAGETAQGAGRAKSPGAACARYVRRTAAQTAAWCYSHRDCSEYSVVTVGPKGRGRRSAGFHSVASAVELTVPTPARTLAVPPWISCGIRGRSTCFRTIAQMRQEVCAGIAKVFSGGIWKNRRGSPEMALRPPGKEAEATPKRACLRLCFMTRCQR